MLTFLIMAGGSGERFWPLSTKEKPKQLLKIFNEKSLIELAYNRILPLTDNDHIFIATNAIQLEALEKELPYVDETRIIIEPGFKDTASAIAYGSMMINKYYENPTICVLASDHLIADENEFRKVIKIANETAQQNQIVTLGIKPTYPETGYGYIEVNDYELNVPTKALKFREKPNKETAIKYLESNRYLWNSGMFIFKYDIIMEAFKMYSKNHYIVVEELNDIVKKNDGVKTAELAKDIFNKFEKKSIDFAIMEYAQNISVIPSSFGWNDVGSYLAFEELFSKDENNNIVRNANVVSIDSHNNIIISQDSQQKLSCLSINDMIIVITKEDILILPKSENQNIKKFIK